MFEPHQIAERIKQYAKEKNTTVKALLQKSGVGEKMVSNMSGRNGSYPQTDKIAKIANTLGCSVDYLIGLTDNPNITSETYNNGDNGIQNVKNGTVNINQSDEMTKEISLLLSNLTYRQKTDLMKQIYSFVDETKKEGD